MKTETGDLYTLAALFGDLLGFAGHAPTCALVLVNDLEAEMDAAFDCDCGFAALVRRVRSIANESPTIGDALLQAARDEVARDSAARQ